MVPLVLISVALQAVERAGLHMTAVREEDVRSADSHAKPRDLPNDVGV